MRFPRTRVIIGVWGFAGDTERALQRFQPSRPAKLVTSLADAVKFVVNADRGLAPDAPVLAARSLSGYTASVPEIRDSSVMSGPHSQAG